MGHLLESGRRAVPCCAPLGSLLDARTGPYSRRWEERAKNGEGKGMKSEMWKVVRNARPWNDGPA